MKPETVEYILAMFRKERQLWRISILEHECDGFKAKLAFAEEAEADFRKDVGV